MAVQKLTPRYLNKDDDARLVKPTEMTDAQNIRISFDDDGDGLVIKNAYGNTEITLDTALPSGTNRVVGSVANEIKGYIYYFVYNTNGAHSIYRYSIGSNTSRQVYLDSTTAANNILQFGETTFVEGNVVNDVKGNELLYFNDSINSPKKINVTKAINGLYPSKFTTGTTEEKSLYFTVAKQPPLTPPSFNIVNNSKLGTSRIVEKNFQFAYRYIYDDGEVSALSPYSPLTASLSQLRDGFNTDSAKKFFNQINVFVKNTEADVKTIEVYVREGNEGTFYLIGEFNNSRSSSVKTIQFTNSSLGPALGSIDQNKLFDNVPILADSQEISAGRLMYGGYTEGYPNTLSKEEVTVLDNYKDTNPIFNVTATIQINGTSVAVDYSSFPNTFDTTTDSKVYINFFINQEELSPYTTTGNSVFIPSSLPDVAYLETNSAGQGRSYNSFELQGIDGSSGGMRLYSSGIQVDKVVTIPKGTSKSDAIDLIDQSFDGERYSSALSPSQLTEHRVQTFIKSSSDFTGTLKGRLTYRVSVEGNSSTTSTDDRIINFNPLGFILQIHELFKNDGTSLDVVRQDEITGSAIGAQFGSAVLNTNTFFATTNGNETKTFKSGSSHRLGIVYYDDRNRSSGVQELGDVYVKALNDRAQENDLVGAASMVLRLPTANSSGVSDGITSPAPSWARKWAPVYVGRGTNDTKFIYGVQGAFVPNRSDLSIASFSSNDVIYLSLNTLFNKTNSYTKSKGAKIEYSFIEGDKLRILRFGDNTTKTKLEFDVAGMVTLNEGDDNPIYQAATDASRDATTGDFLILKNNEEASNFNISAINNQTSKWFESCIVEVYRARPISDTPLYYEIGECYDITSGNHVGDRSSSDLTSISVTITSSSVTTCSGTTDKRLYKGDILTFSDSGSTFVLEVTNAYVTGTTNHFHARPTNNQVPAAATYAGAGSVSNKDIVIEFSNGDAYFRLRSMFVSLSQAPAQENYRIFLRQSAIVDYIDDYCVSDFFPSEHSSIGRAITVIPDASTVKRSGSITYSEPFLVEGTFNGLSSFNLSEANFKDLDYSYGSIKAMISYNEKLYFIQETRAGVLAVNRNVIQTGDADNLVSLSKSILQSEQYYMGEYGTINRESVSHRDGKVYYCDVNNGKVVRIDSQGLTVISDVNMASYFDDKFGTISQFPPQLVVSGMDNDNDEYIVSCGTITQAGISINTTPSATTFKATLDPNTTESPFAILAETIESPSNVFSFDTDPRNFNESFDNFNRSLEALVYLDNLQSGGSVFTVNLNELETTTLYGIATDSAFNFFVPITVNPANNTFAFDNDHSDDEDGTISSDGVVLSPFTIAYSTSDRVWSTRYSYTPESIISLHDTLFTFSAGKIFKHDETANRNTYYGGSAAASIVETISNALPSSIKAFETISLEGDSTWGATISTTKQTSVLADTAYAPTSSDPLGDDTNGIWREKEGFYYAYIHGDTVTDGASTISAVTTTSQIFPLGTVASDSSGTTITFANAIDKVPFPLGTTAALYKLSGSNLVKQSVTVASITSENVLTMSGAIAVSALDVLVVVANSSIEGDQIRDYFAKINLTKTSSNAIELYAINMSFADSKLHY